ncbi:MAG: hypothetical protein SGCHY_003901 [Lobulomycetales sp.]
MKSKTILFLFSVASALPISKKHGAGLLAIAASSLHGAEPFSLQPPTRNPLAANMRPVVSLGALPRPEKGDELENEDDDDEPETPGDNGLDLEDIADLDSFQEEHPDILSLEDQEDLEDELTEYMNEHHDTLFEEFEEDAFKALLRAIDEEFDGQALSEEERAEYLGDGDTFEDWLDEEMKELKEFKNSLIDSDAEEDDAFEDWLDEELKELKEYEKSLIDSDPDAWLKGKVTAGNELDLYFFLDSFYRRQALSISFAEFRRLVTDYYFGLLESSETTNPDTLTPLDRAISFAMSLARKFAD